MPSVGPQYTIASTNEETFVVDKRLEELLKNNSKRHDEDEESYGKTVAAFLRRLDAKKARKAKMVFERIMYEFEFGDDDK